MEPAFGKGDCVKVKLGVTIDEIYVAPKPDGDIIAFHKPTYPLDLIIHRAVGKGTDTSHYLITQGDANPGPDGWRVRDTDIVGKVVEINPPFWTYNYIFWIIILGMGTVFIVISVVIRQRGPTKVGIVQEKPTPAEGRKRPTGLTIIAILWFLGGIYNLYMSSQVISDDLEVLPHLSDPWVAEWFRFGVPAELAISLLVFALGIIQMFTIIGLWTGKSWSYKLALATPVLLVTSNILMTTLYMTAPIDLGIREGATENVGITGMSVFWAILIFFYLRQSHVKEYLRAGIVRLPEPSKPAKEMDKLEKTIPRTEEVVHCIYCGEELPSQAVYCRKCGKKIE